MATVKLGVMVSDIAGSLGAVTFRRFRGTTIVSQKQRGASRNTLFQNSAINILSPIFQEWKGLSDAVRDKWDAEALLFTFPDKFGTMRNITGRELYVKLNTNCVFAKLGRPDVNALSNVVPAVTGSLSASVSLAGNLVLASTGLFPSQRYTIQSNIRKNDAISPTYTRRKILTSITGIGDPTLVFVGFLSNYMPLAIIGNKMYFYLKIVNSSGFKSDAYLFKATVVA